MDKQKTTRRVHGVLLVLAILETLREFFVAVSNTDMGYEAILTNAERSLELFNYFIICSTVITIFALSYSLYYLASGYKKSESQSYVKFLYMFIIIWVFEMFSSLFLIETSVVVELLEIVVLAVLLLLAFGKNLGKKVTFILGYILTGVNAIIAALLIAKYTSAPLTPVAIHIISSAVIYVVLSFTTVIMISGKYYDKEQRGTY